MPTGNYKRTVEELRTVAAMFWPAELSLQEAELSVIPKLLETQDQFIAILSVDVPNLAAFFRVVESSRMPANLFLKHLVVLADFGGEMLQRINREFAGLFPSGVLDYIVDEQQYSYQFAALPIRGPLTNTKLGISGRTLLNDYPPNDLFKDVVALLLHGSTAPDENTSEILAKCQIGSYLGKPDQLTQFIKQRYIWVSRITGGARANTLGQIAQEFVVNYLENHLRIHGVNITRNGHLPNITHTDTLRRGLTTFDVVISRDDKYAAIEVSFQVTTNSTIERKAGQARSRFEQIEEAGYKIAYVIDGAGNFQRENAIRTLCSFSHCTVAFTQAELDVLCEFLRVYLGD